MLENFEKIKNKSIAAILVQIIIMAILVFLFGLELFWIGLLVLVVEVVLFIYVLYNLDRELSKNVINISRVLGNDAKNSLMFGGVGLVVYDDNNTITWMSDLFEAKNISKIGTKVSEWNPEFIKLFKEDINQVIVTLGDSVFEVVKASKDRLMYFREITDYYNLKQTYDKNKLVVGLIHLDNYEETTQFEEEQTIYFIDSQIRQPLISWAIDNQMMIKRVKPDRYLVILNEESFRKIKETNFSILSSVRNTSQQNDLSITLTMAFARESNDMAAIDETLYNLLELAQSRGGDQVAYRKVGKQVKYFGGRSESVEKRSKVRVRVISNTIRDLLQEASNVIIVGHANMDFDCLGSAIGMSNIAKGYDKAVYVISKSGGIEPKLQETYDSYYEVLSSKHNFIDENKAISLLDENSLIIMVDHHSVTQTSSPKLIEQADKIVVIDHHRRSSDFTFDTMLVYVEPSASSVTELIVEFFTYQNNRIDLSVEEATIMMTGIIVDTLNFKNRTSSRTFEAASVLKKYGADMVLADKFLKDEYEEFTIKNNIINTIIPKGHGIMVAPYNQGVVNRTLMSQAADAVLQIKDVEASFVISKINDKEVAVSARSNGKVNVQTIIETIGGGGHFNAAAFQKEGTVEELAKKLDEAIVKYFEEDNS